MHFALFFKKLWKVLEPFAPPLVIVDFEWCNVNDVTTFSALLVYPKLWMIVVETKKKKMQKKRLMINF
jgi:hypothetical protein